MVQIISKEILGNMTELDKEMYRRQLKDEIQYLIKKEFKVTASQEEVVLLEKNLSLE